ncbi:MAG: hypothetical protein ACI4U2_03125 [Christensenellaceae bacterium]
MIQKRRNPLDLHTAVSEEATSADQTEPLEERVIVDAEPPAPVVIGNEYIAAEEVGQMVPPVEEAEAASSPVAEAVALPRVFVGSPKKTFVFALVSKTLYAEAVKASGTKGGELINDALVSYLSANHPETIDAVREALKEEGCDLR